MHIANTVLFTAMQSLVLGQKQTKGSLQHHDDSQNSDDEDSDFE